MSKMQNDRRVRKTKKALREELAELLSEKELRSITVKELTDKADIHRSTFYAHYEDIYSLYQEIEDTVLEELNDLISSNFFLSLNDYYKILFDYINENKQLCKMLFRNKSTHNFLHNLALLFKNACLKSWRIALNITDISEELEYYAEYHLQGCFAMISKWADSDFAYPREKMIKIMANVDANMEIHLKRIQHQGSGDNQ
ncbi:TetR/AcrR family transcriptional regulator [Oceanobacillus sp. J11TS1]|uniref:TetR/AcrR family transcriptional regulator n=1 Tax=Oceanobacillus sp. J11TS1 TaxID=2807191 RepID=UPI001B16A439|nr:TetR-like C-terminal domain-containing protein [Oceanobacillus sp. J11TS1]GIO22884.1 TetR family transcriptional regulator [Oceanobacillus sp. J11TS1]